MKTSFKTSATSSNCSKIPPGGLCQGQKGLSCNLVAESMLFSISWGSIWLKTFFFLLFLICGVDVVLNDLNGTADHLKMREECWIWGNLNSTKSKTSGNVPTFSTVVGTTDCSEISTFSLLAEKKRVFPPSSTRFPDGEVQCLQLRWSLHAHFGV